MTTLFSILLLTLAFFTKQAEGFGQNKVQYEPFEWKYIQTEHFDVYYPQEADIIAKFAASHVEEMYSGVSTMLGHKLQNRIPIILHNSHAEFEQTNVIRMPLHEGIGGFTEVFKNRIVLPFEGNYSDFYHVLNHELVHGVMFDLLFGSGAGAVASRAAGNRFPLWVDEGLAEYTSLGWDLSSEFFMLDATTFGYVRSPVQPFGGFLAYKGGQLFMHFLDKSFGAGTVTRFITELYKSRDLEGAFKTVTKLSLEEVGEIWLRELRTIYWPELGQRQYGKAVARQLTRHGEDLSFFNLQPAISPDGKKIAFFSDRDTWEGIYLLDIKKEKVSQVVLQGGKGGSHESFHSFKSGIAWSPDSKRMAIVSKSQGKDVLHIVDAKRGRVREEIDPDVQAILSPDWSRDGRYLVYSGIKAGYCDLYLWDRELKTNTRLTHDLAFDGKPVFSPSGKWIAFESDRSDSTHATKNPLDEYKSHQKYLDIYRINIDGTGLKKVVSSEYDDKMPSFGTADSLLSFVSNRSGIDNIYIWHDSSGTLTEKPITNLLSGCFTPSWARQGNLMAFSLFEQGGWDIFLMKDPLKKIIPNELPKTHFMKVMGDSTLPFYRPIPLANLTSYNKDIDSTKSKEEKKKGRKGKAKEKQAETKLDSLDIEADSSKIVRNDSLGLKEKKVDSSLAKVIGTKIPDTLSQDSEKVNLEVPKTTVEARAMEENRDTLGVLSADSGKFANGKNPFLMDSSAYLTSDGRFIEKKYSPQFSLDMASAAIGYDNFYGAAGMAYITLSDLMGDQEISFVLDLNGDQFTNTNAMVTYEYLPLKPDIAVSAYHQVYGQSRPAWYSPDSNYLDRIWGFGASLQFPQSIYTRTQFDVRSLFASRTRQVAKGDEYVSVDSPLNQQIDAIVPSLSWHHDNSLWGHVGPVNGERMETRLQVVPPIFQHDFFFYVLEGDVRKYWQFFKKYTLALRLSAGLSDPMGGYENPHSFLVGGDQVLNLYPLANAGNAPNTLPELYFSDLEFPVRGFKYYDFRGTRKFVSNFEFRYPFIREFSFDWPIPLAIRNITGVLFTDYGGAWSRGNALDQLGWGYGWGMRVNLGVFVLRYTRSWTVDGVGGYSERQRDYWSLGAEF